MKGELSMEFLHVKRKSVRERYDVRLREKWIEIACDKAIIRRIGCRLRVQVTLQKLLKSAVRQSVRSLKAVTWFSAVCVCVWHAAKESIHDTSQSEKSDAVKPSQTEQLQL
jgi:hypothetical protein